MRYRGRYPWKPVRTSACAPMRGKYDSSAASFRLKASFLTCRGVISSLSAEPRVKPVFRCGLRTDLRRTRPPAGASNRIGDVWITWRSHGRWEDEEASASAHRGIGRQAPFVTALESIETCTALKRSNASGNAPVSQTLTPLALGCKASIPDLSRISDCPWRTRKVRIDCGVISRSGFKGAKMPSLCEGFEHFTHQPMRNVAITAARVCAGKADRLVAEPVTMVDDDDPSARGLPQ
jgi:hypothetical protein